MKSIKKEELLDDITAPINILQNLKSQLVNLTGNVVRRKFVILQNYQKQSPYLDLSQDELTNLATKIGKIFQDKFNECQIGYRKFTDTQEFMIIIQLKSTCIGNTVISLLTSKLGGNIHINESNIFITEGQKSSRSTFHFKNLFGRNYKPLNFRNSNLPQKISGIGDGEIDSDLEVIDEEEQNNVIIQLPQFGNSEINQQNTLQNNINLSQFSTNLNLNQQQQHQQQSILSFEQSQQQQDKLKTQLQDQLKNNQQQIFKLPQQNNQFFQTNQQQQSLIQLQQNQNIKNEIFQIQQQQQNQFQQQHQYQQQQQNNQNLSQQLNKINYQCQNKIETISANNFNSQEDIEKLSKQIGLMQVSQDSLLQSNNKILKLMQDQQQYQRNEDNINNKINNIQQLQDELYKANIKIINLIEQNAQNQQKIDSTQQEQDAYNLWIDMEIKENFNEAVNKYLQKNQKSFEQIQVINENSIDCLSIFQGVKELIYIKYCSKGDKYIKFFSDAFEKDHKCLYQNYFNYIKTYFKEQQTVNSNQNNQNTLLLETQKQVIQQQSQSNSIRQNQPSNYSLLIPSPKNKISQENTPVQTQNSVFTFPTPQNPQQHKCINYSQQINQQNNLSQGAFNFQINSDTINKIQQYIGQPQQLQQKQHQQQQQPIFQPTINQHEEQLFTSKCQQQLHEIQQISKRNYENDG